MPLRIDYESDGFPSGMPALTGQHTLTTSWDDLLWSAITVGRPHRSFVFQHGDASVYEAIFRLSLIRMAVEESWRQRLRRTAAARTLDPTEKGAVNYFLGMTLCKLFASELLGAPWMLHLDVFRPTLDVQLASRSRPDLIGQRANGDWIAIECKGRISQPDSGVKTRAKQQATRVVSVRDATPAFHVGAISYFKNDIVRFYWRDPEPDPEIRNPIRVEPTPESWAFYYWPALELVKRSPDTFAQMLSGPAFMPVEEVDIEIGIHPKVLRRLEAAEWEEARRIASEQGGEGDYHPDGIAVKAGPSWQQRQAAFAG